MNKLLLSIAFFFINFCNIHAQNPPKRELRGVWITTHLSLDWPNRTQTPAQQQSALQGILDFDKATGLNAAFFQVRSQCDAMYPSSLEPWSYYLTNNQGTPPSPLWDPLQFALDETHKRGMEFHAWINPYRAVYNTANANNAAQYCSTHVSKTHPEWMLTIGTVQILNPGLQEVRDHITNVIVDIVKRYDVDGIHFDDYFYQTGTINDDAAYTADPRGFPATTAGRADWRRDNINLLINRVSDSINLLKPWVKFGVSPSGIYRSSTDPSIGSPTSSGAYQHYSAAFADTKKWIQQGWVDYLAPQVYWYIGQTGSDYQLLIPWWNNNAFGRHICIGMADYKVGTTGWTNTSEIPNQIRMNRSNANVRGQIHFRHAFLVANALNYRDSLRLRFYNKPALIPDMPWKDNVAPDAPTALNGTRYGADSVVLSWTKPAATTNELDKVKRFVIYRSETSVINLNDANNIVGITPFDTTAFKDSTIIGNTTYYYTVTALDRLYNESISSNTIQSSVSALPITLLHFSVNRLNNEYAKIDWQTEQEYNVEKFEVLRSLDGLNFLPIGSVVARNTNRTEYYSFANLISGVNGIIYYRLKIIDKDGSFRYSDVRIINTGKGAEWVKIFPTILQRNTPLQVRIISSGQGSVYYNLFNGGGQKIANGILSNSGLVNTGGLTAGIYIIQILQGDQYRSLQFVIQ